MFELFEFNWLSTNKKETQNKNLYTMYSISLIRNIIAKTNYWREGEDEGGSNRMISNYISMFFIFFTRLISITWALFGNRISIDELSILSAVTMAKLFNSHDPMVHINPFIFDSIIFLFSTSAVLGRRRKKRIAK